MLRAPQELYCSFLVHEAAILLTGVVDMASLITPDTEGYV